MIDAVGTLSVSKTSARQVLQAAVSAVEATAAVSSSRPEGFVASRIRVDNLQDVAILEYRSSRTGEVVRQYPTESQIEAFRAAEQLRTAAAKSAASVASSAESGGSTPVEAQEQVAAAPVPETTAPAPAAPAAQLSAPATAPSSGGDGAATSVVV